MSRPNSKPPSEAASSKPSSLKSAASHPESAKSGLAPPPDARRANGTSTPSPVPDIKPAEKASVKDRLTRMFMVTPSSQSGSRNASGLTSPAPASTPRKPPQADKADKAADKATAPKSSAKTAAGKTPVPKDKDHARFVVNAEAQGGHEHYLRNSRRQEKLSDMWRSLIGKRHETPDNDLSLVTSWMDRQDKEGGMPVPERKPGNPALMTLTEKYGKCHEVIGRGAFGVVRISHKKLDNGGGEKLYAVKEFRRRPDETERKYNKRLTSEFCISSSLHHPNVIHTLDLLKDAKGDYCEVMEFCAGGDLHSLVVSAVRLEPQEADCYFKQLMRGVNYLHENGVAHRDLKPENLLLTTRGAIKITDFGNGECFRMAWEADAHMVSGLCGSAPYIAPEEYTDREFDPRAVDVWACGVIYMAMRTGRHLWHVAKKEDDEFYARYLDGRKDEEGYGPIETLHRARCRNVVYSILDPNPSRRLTASQVLKSEWGREIKLCHAGEEGL